MPIERKLAAIMFTDIAGYTALSAKDETKALNLLDIQKKILTPIIKEFNGTLHKEMGDGLLFTFPTVTEAVKCGIKIQGQTKDSDDLNLRIGIHEGEITLKDGDALGDDVNVASRIEAFAPIGGIAISSKVQQNISSLPEFETSYVGKPELKGVAQEINLYCITSYGLPKADKIVEPTIKKRESNFNVFALIAGVCVLVAALFFVFTGKEEQKVPSIAIIPLDNKGESKDDFYSYSISADLISDVSRAGDIRVASIKDIEKIDYGSLTNKELAKKLFVRYISQGTLWKVDSIFQLSLELYDTKKGEIKWSKNWQEKWSDLPSIKGHLSEDILINLNIETKPNLVKAESVNAHAYELYLKAKSIYEKRENIDDTRIARELLNKALELDNNLISAKNLLGITYVHAGDFEKAMTIFHSNLKQAEKIGEKYGMSKALNGIGVLESIKGNYNQALEYYEKSLELRLELGDKGGVASNFVNMGNVYANQGDFEKTLSYFNQAHSISEQLDDKGGMGTSLNNIGLLYGIKGQYNKAIDYYKKSLSIRKQLNDNMGMGYNLNNIGIAYYNKKNYREALKYLEESLSIQQEMHIKDTELPTIIHLYLVYKYYGMDYDQEYLDSLLSGSENFEINFRLYFLLENKSFLKHAYSQVQESASGIEEELGKTFLSYPIPKAIVNEYKKLNKDNN